MRLTLSPPIAVSSRAARWGLVAAIVCAWVYLVFFHDLGERDLWNSHEARAAMDAQTILDDGEWLVPRLYDGRRDLQKPPLYYWMVAGIAQLRSGAVDSLAVRLPSTIAALVTVGLLVLLGWRCGRLREGVLAGVFLATMIHFTWLAHVGRIDMPLTAALAGALVCFYVGQAVPDGTQGQSPPDARWRWVWLLAGYLCIAVAVLLKGPIGLVLPAAVVACHLAIEGRLPAPWRLRQWAVLSHRLGTWWGLPLVAAVAGSWFLLANHGTDGALWRVFIVYHNLERGLGGSNLRGHPWWFYGPRLVVDCLPWSLLFPAAIIWLVRSGRWGEHPELRFGVAWLAAMVIVLSVARYKRADYLVPAYPGLALFLGHSICPLSRKRQVGLGIVLACTAVGWWVRVEHDLPASEPQREHRTFAAVVRRHAPTPEAIVLFRTEAHALAFHLGRPIRSFVRWDDLDRLNDDRYVVMPSAVAAKWEQHLRNVTLVELSRTIDGHEKPLVLFRSERVHSMSRNRDP